MKLKHFSILLSSFLMMAVSFYTNAIDFKSAKNLESRIETPAYSILSPKEVGWVYGFENPIKIHLGKSGAMKEGQSFAGMVTMSRLPRIETKEEYFKFVSAQRARDLVNSRYENLINDESVSNNEGFYIFHFHTRYKDYDAKNLPSNSNFLIIDDYGAIFQHPYNPNISVYIALSQRAKKEDLRDDFEVLAKEFISNIKFKEFNE